MQIFTPSAYAYVGFKYVTHQFHLPINIHQDDKADQLNL